MERPFKHTHDMVKFTCYVDKKEDEYPTWTCCHCGEKRMGSRINRCPNCFKFPKWEYTAPTYVALFISLKRKANLILRDLCKKIEKKLEETY